MNDQQITRLEAQLEKLVEGVFAHLFGKRIRAHDIALQIARSMEDSLEPAHDGDTRPLAPDRYLIRVNAEVQSQILRRYPGLTKVLSEQIIELAANVGYRLNNAPIVLFIADPGLSNGQLLVKADHINQKHNTTQVMQPIRMESAHDPPDNAQLIIKGQKAYELQQAIVNIGRSRDNHIVIEDPHSSRYHAQIRLRFGYYTIFDANSQSGTFVNDVRIKEHRLQPGDVIRIGMTSLLYMEDDRLSDSQTGPLNSI
jgi:pSer/pThr/pTyr-binding forkhead associated (FHA) protein